MFKRLALIAALLLWPTASAPPRYPARGWVKCSGGELVVEARCPADRQLRVYCDAGRPVARCGAKS